MTESTTEDVAFGSGLQAPPAADPIATVIPERYNEGLLSSLKPIAAVTEARASAELEELRTTLSKAEPSIRIHADALRDVWRDTQARREAIANDPNLSPAGRALKLAEDNARLEAEMARLDANANQAIEKIGRVADVTRPPLTADLAGAVSVAWSRIDKQAAKTTMEQAAEYLRIANDASASNEVRYVASVHLADVYKGWLERVDESAPPHYRPYAAAISALRGAVDRHVDVTFGGYRQRAARAFAQALREDWTWSRGAAADQGKFDDDIQALGVPRLFGRLDTRNRGNG